MTRSDQVEADSAAPIAGVGRDLLGTVELSTLREVAPGIFYTPHEFVLVDDALMRFLKDKARTAPARRARLCAHPSPEADQHDMLIASHRDTYVAPHRHPKSESFLVIEGEADLLLFEADGRLARRITMGPANSSLPMFYRMPAGRYHSLAIRSEVLLFVESTRGPFSRQDMDEAPWAPPTTDADAGRAYIAALPELGEAAKPYSTAKEQTSLGNG
jgi:cupin fold WbuC family metalloprotein